MIKSKRAVACEMFSSGVCNIECSYCYIPKVKEMKKIHQEILGKIKNGTYIKELKDIFGDQLEYLSFWGTEPTLTLKAIIPSIPDILEAFPKLSSFGWSSNFMTDPQIMIDFVKAIPNDRCFDINIQASLDGPTEVSDKNRAPGATKKITENVIKLLELLNDVDLKNKTVKVTSKPTWDSSNLEYYNEDISRLYGYFEFFDDLIGKIKGTIKNPNVLNHFSSLSSLAVPGQYTKADGQLFSEVCEKIYEIEAKNMKEKIFKNIGGPLQTYELRLKRAVDFQNELAHKTSMFTCSGADSNFAVDERGYIHICHRSFYLNNEAYTKEVLDNKVTEGWEISNFDRASLEVTSKNFIADSRDQDAVNRFMFVNGHYHNFWKVRLGSSLSLIKEFADCGLISPIYGKNDQLALMLSLFIHVAHSCPMENVLTTGVVNLAPASLYKIYANGAFEQFIQQLARKEE